MELAATRLKKREYICYLASNIHEVLTSQGSLSMTSQLPADK